MIIRSQTKLKEGSQKEEYILHFGEMSQDELQVLRALVGSTTNRGEVHKGVFITSLEMAGSKLTLEQANMILWKIFDSFKEENIE